MKRMMQGKKMFMAMLLMSITLLASIWAYAEYGDLVLDSKIESMKKVGVRPVIFAHWFHRIRFKCKVCHQDIFIMRRGSNDIDMKKIMHGKLCGACHNGIIAFAPLECELCHSKTTLNIPVQDVLK